VTAIAQPHATARDKALQFYGSMLQILPALLLDSKKGDAAISVIEGLHYFAVFLGSLPQAELWGALFDAALARKRAEPLQEQIRLLRRVLALAPRSDDAQVTEVIRQLYAELEDLERSSQIRSKLHETYEAIESDARHLATLREHEQSKILQRLKDVTRAAEKEQRRLARIAQRSLGRRRMPRVLRSTRLRPRARRSPRRARRLSVACRRQESGSADAAGDPPPGPPRRPGVSRRSHASADQLRWPRSPNPPHGKGARPKAIGAVQHLRSAVFAAASTTRAQSFSEGKL